MDDLHSMPVLTKNFPNSTHSKPGLTSLPVNASPSGPKPEGDLPFQSLKLEAHVEKHSAPDDKLVLKLQGKNIVNCTAPIMPWSRCY